MCPAPLRGSRENGYSGVAPAIVGLPHTNSNRATRPHWTRRTQRDTIQLDRSFGKTVSPPYRNSSSKTNGIATASANGHPTIAPVANASVAKRVRRKFVLVGTSSESAKATEFAYIANDDGRKASRGHQEHPLTRYGKRHSQTDAFHIPALKSIKNSMYRPAL